MDKNKLIIENKIPKANNIKNIFFFLAKFIWALYSEINLSLILSDFTLFDCFFMFFGIFLFI